MRQQDDPDDAGSRADTVEAAEGGQAQAARAIMNLVVNDDNKVTLMELGAGPNLLKLLEEGIPDAMSEAAGATTNLTTNDDNKAALMKLGAGSKLLKRLDEGTPDAKEEAARAIMNLATNDDN
jgi:vacuolar protein 8